MLLLNRLIKKRKNFIYKSSMARTRNYKMLVKKLKKHDYEIRAYVVYVPLSVAIERDEKRAQRTGRKVPYKVIKHTHKLVQRTLKVISCSGICCPLCFYSSGLKCMASFG